MTLGTFAIVAEIPEYVSSAPALLLESPNTTTKIEATNVYMLSLCYHPYPARSEHDDSSDGFDFEGLGVDQTNSGLFQADMPLNDVGSWEVNDEEVFSGVDFETEALLHRSRQQQASNRKKVIHDLGSIFHRRTRCSLSGSDARVNAQMAMFSTLRFSP